MGKNVGAAVSATDQEGDTLTYSMSGTDAGKLTLSTSTGQITVKSGNVPNYESGKTSYSVTLSVTDNKKADGTADSTIDDTITVSISVTDVNEPPAAPTPTVSQNSTTPKTKLDVSWTAPNMTGKPPITDYDVRYRKHLSLLDPWKSLTHNGTSTTASISGLDEGTEYEVQVKAYNAEGDSGWSSSGRASTQDKNVNPSFPSDTASRSVAENSTAGTNVGAVVTTTDTEGDTLYYSLAGTDAASFDIASTTGQIKVKSALDYEAKSSYSVTVGVSDKKDSDDNSDTKVDDTIAVTISVTDVNEPPAAPAAPSVWQHSPTPKTQLDVSWSAPDMTGKPAVTDYDIRYKKTATSTWSDLDAHRSDDHQQADRPGPRARATTCRSRRRTTRVSQRLVRHRQGDHAGQERPRRVPVRDRAAQHSRELRQPEPTSASR